MLMAWQCHDGINAMKSSGPSIEFVLACMYFFPPNSSRLVGSGKMDSFAAQDWFALLKNDDLQSLVQPH
jgi:hypothetical protein